MQKQNKNCNKKVRSFSFLGIFEYAFL